LFEIYLEFSNQTLFSELDGIELAHIRMLSLLNPNKCFSSELKQREHHSKITKNLQTYEGKKTQGASLERMISIYQATGILQMLHSKTIEKLFFNILVDFIKIDHVIPYIMSLNSNPKEYKHDVKKENDLDLNDENNEPRYYSENC
jgi:hypothetical protein